MQLLILFTVAVFILLVGLAFIQKPLYQQIGPTCGFYALVYGIRKVSSDRIDKKKEVRKIIEESINCGDSYVGEIFDINIMERIVRKYYSDIKVKVVEIRSTDDLDRYLENNYVIYPLVKNTIPHYVFLENEKKRRYLYRHVYFARLRKEKKEEFFQWHQNLKNLLSYKWVEFYDERKGYWLKMCSDVMGLFQRVSDYKLYKFLKENKEKKRNDLYGTETNIDMFGRILIISKEDSISQ